MLLGSIPEEAEQNTRESAPTTTSETGRTPGPAQKTFSNAVVKASD